MIKRHLALTLTTAALLLGASPYSAVLAEDGTPPLDTATGADNPAAQDAPGRKGPGGKGSHKPGKMFDEADANKDGMLTRDEMKNAHQKRIDEMFDKLDTDKSGTVTREEIAKGRDQMRQTLRQRMMERKAQKGGDAGSERPFLKRRDQEDGGMSFDEGE